METALQNQVDQPSTSTRRQFLLLNTNLFRTAILSVFCFCVFIPFQFLLGLSSRRRERIARSRLLAEEQNSLELEPLSLDARMDLLLSEKTCVLYYRFAEPEYICPFDHTYGSNRWLSQRYGIDPDELVLGLSQRFGGDITVIEKMVRDLRHIQALPHDRDNFNAAAARELAEFIGKSIDFATFNAKWEDWQRWRIHPHLAPVNFIQ